MSAKDLEFSKSEVLPGSKIYSIERAKGDAILEVYSGDTINFMRSGDDDNMGFTVTFKGELAPDTFSVPEGEKGKTITVPESKKELWWKYKVSFSNDSKLPGTDAVIPYDPIIIINPGMSSSSVYTKYAAVFIAGAAVAYLAMLFFPRLLG